MFLGTPAFAVPSLVALTDVAEVVGVVCQPDKPAGRGLELSLPAVKREALARGLVVHQPTKMRDGSFAEWLRAQGADLAVVAAYGRILPSDVLAAPRLGCVNVHASLLPRHRGAAPIQWAILAGDEQTGVTLMQMDEGLDTGPMLGARSVPIGVDETSEQLYSRLADLGGAMVRDEISRFLRGEVAATPQDVSRVTLAPPLTKQQAQIEWTRSARQVHDQIRGLQPWPGTWTMLGATKAHRACERARWRPTPSSGCAGRGGGRDA